MMQCKSRATGLRFCGGPFLLGFQVSSTTSPGDQIVNQKDLFLFILCNRRRQKMLAVNCSSSSSTCPPPPPLGSHLSGPDNGVLVNMSPTLFSYFNPIVQLDRTLPNKASPCCDSEEVLGCTIINSFASTPKSSTELKEEIATLELEIMHLERHLLSLYRTAFQGCALPSTPESRLQFKTGHSKLELQMHRGGLVHHDQTSPAHRRVSSDNRNSATSIKAPSNWDRKINSRHRSLADHLGGTCNDSTLNTPDRLSEDIVRCISSIYCKLANPQTHTCPSVSPASSLSSSIFSSKNPCDSWSPHCNEDATMHHQGLKENSGPYATMIEVLKICLNDDSFNYAAMMLQNFRSLVRSLEKVDVLKMKREEKLVFWINIHNALVMHAYLAYGTHSRVKSTSILKAAYNIGGHCINAYIIQSSILGIRAHHSAPWLQTLFHSGRKLKTGSIRHAYKLEYPEPLVHFALCSGAYSDPAVRAYRAKSIFQDLKLAKKEFIQANVFMYKETKLFLPKILYYFAKDMSLGMLGLLEEINDCLSDIQKKAIRSCMAGKLDKYIQWLPQSSTFRLLDFGQNHAAKTNNRPFPRTERTSPSFQRLLWTGEERVVVAAVDWHSLVNHG
ncbi:hypothetical protein Pyn_23719 [Prunus yedoensis var. nudiflora]|uniref:DUF547 domain-containing protein n=1 Tax=Prunus yedoensis var. nudiflora TaxID=2094558 RepID=A0A314ZL71_PRUYE|nr:hypothetical protein Pyn_23719 [Prunus yedoensis var. nudiflora]